MNRREFLGRATAGLLGLYGLGFYRRGWCRQTRRPNILFIFIDDMGYADLSCFGNPKVRTANIDRLAAEGMRLTQFYVNSPICSPSRVAVMTGQYPSRWKIHSYLASRKANRRRQMADWLDPKAPMTARILREAGYATAHFGKWHIGGGRDVHDSPLPEAYGFDESLVAFEGHGERVSFSDAEKNGTTEQYERGTITYMPKHEVTETYVDRAIQFMRQQEDRPFYIELFPNDVHDPHQPTEQAAERWKEATDNPYEQKFFAVLHELDRQIGRIVAEVDRLGLGERTLIVLTSDNGPTDWPSYYREGYDPPGFTGPFFGRKWSLYEGGIRMPFIARWTGTIPAGRVNESTVMCGIDLAPTFCRFAGVETGESVRHDGQAMNEALLGEPIQRKTPIFWQYGDPYARLRPGNPDFVSPSLAVRDGKWKLLINSDGSDAQLYDLAIDRQEATNLLQKYPEKAAELWKKIQQWAHSVGVETTPGLPRPPRPPVTIQLCGDRCTFDNMNVQVAERGNSTVYVFNGDAYLELPRNQAPDIGQRAITVSARVEARCQDGVILAYGGDRFGYSLHVRQGRGALSITNDWNRTTLIGPEALPSQACTITANVDKQGRAALCIDNSTVARGQSNAPLSQSPGDSLQIGADLIQPVGAYDVPNCFRGTIAEITFEVD